MQENEKLTGHKITEFKGENNKSYSIHLTFSAKEDAGLRQENECFKRAGIFAKEISRKEIEKIFGKNNTIFSAYYYPSDSNILFDAHQTNRKIAKERGVKWRHSKTNFLRRRIWNC
ncbi:MAG: hypothetical protein KGQ36_02620 [Rickettsiales bacterium]|nr:hypothetical protein [Rickettsiales bacterium]